MKSIITSFLLFFYIRFSVILSEVVNENIYYDKSGQLELSLADRFKNNGNSTLYISVGHNEYVHVTVESANISGRYDFLHVRQMIVSGDFLFLMERGNIFRIVDISSISNPIFLSMIDLGPYCLGMDGYTDISCDEEHQYDLSVEGEYAFVATKQLLLVLDIFDKMNPLIVDSVDFGMEEVDAAFVRNDFAYVFGERNDDDGKEFLVYNIINTTKPVLLGYSSAPFTSNGDLYLKEDLAILSSNSWFVICNISDPTNLEFSDKQNNPSNIMKMAMGNHGEYLYVADYSSGLGIYRMNGSKNSEVPNFISSTGSFAYDVSVTKDNDIVIVAFPYEGVMIYNVSNSSQPILISSIEDVSGYAVKLNLLEDEGILIIGKEYGLSIYNISSGFKNDSCCYELLYELIGKEEEDEVGNGWHASGVFEEDGFLYVAEWKDGLRIFDVRGFGNNNNNMGVILGENTSAIICSSFFEKAKDVIVKNRTAFVADETRGLVVVNVSDPWKPELISTLESGMVPSIRIYYNYHEKDDNYNYVYTIGGDELRIVDVKNISDPVLVGVWSNQTICDEVTDVHIARDDNIAYIVGKIVKDNDGVLVVVDISNKSEPTAVKWVTQSYPISGISVDKQWAIVTLQSSIYSFEAYDISSPYDPVDIEIENWSLDDHSCPFQSRAVSGVLKNDMFYMLCEDEGLRVFDFKYALYGSKFEDPKDDNPLLLTIVKTFNPVNLFVSGNNVVYIADAQQGVKEITLDLHIVGYEEFQYILCGMTRVSVTGESVTSTCSYKTINIHKEDYCHGHGTCGFVVTDYEYLENTRGYEKGYFCECDGKWKGDFCEQYSCFDVGYKDEEVCGGRGKCTDADKCECKFWFAGKKCDIDVLSILIAIPSVIIPMLVIVCFFFCCGCAVLSLGLVVGTVVFCTLYCCIKQNESLRKFEQLQNFDLLLREQKLERDMSVAHLRINNKLFQIPFEEINTISILGEGGSNSIVFKAKWSGRLVAFKCFKTKTLMSTQDNFDEFEREVEILGSLSHPNIIRFFGATMKPPRVGIVMEYASNGEMLHYIKKFRDKSGRAYPLFQKLRLLGQVIRAMEFLHSRSIIHRDIKSENILIDSKEDTKLMDFGLSRLVKGSEKLTRRVGTDVYMAPEVVTDSMYSEKCDVYSFSILFFIVLTEDEMPYGEGEFQVEMRVASDPKFRPELKNIEDEIVEENPWIENVIETCWSQKPSERYSFTQLGEIFEKRGKTIIELDQNNEEKEEEHEVDNNIQLQQTQENITTEEEALEGGTLRDFEEMKLKYEVLSCLYENVRDLVLAEKWEELKLKFKDSEITGDIIDM